MEKKCVSGHNLDKYEDKTVAECKELCDASKDCLGFEYGMTYEGSSAAYQPRDCQLSNGVDTTDCNGVYFNLDFYKKGDCTGDEYILMPVSVRECPADAEITTKEECGRAFEDIKARYKLDNKRSLYAGNWNHVPAFCSVQRPGDDTPHFNSNANPPNPKGYSVLCKGKLK